MKGELAFLLRGYHSSRWGASLPAFFVFLIAEDVGHSQQIDKGGSFLQEQEEVGANIDPGKVQPVVWTVTRNPVLAVRPRTTCLASTIASHLPGQS